jgi:diacylglycerol kinase (ATP)
MAKIKNAGIADSFNAAIEGFLFAVKTQRNMRIHFLLALLVVLLGIYLNFTKIELIVLLLTCSLVLIAEMINTAMEIVMDYVEKKHTPWVKAVKDISAGAVLTASVTALIVGYFLFLGGNMLPRLFHNQVLKLSASDWHISMLIFISLIGIVIVSKAFFHKGQPLRGGMPSGHSAIAFSIWMLVTLLSENTLTVLTVLLLAFLVAQSRVRRNYHTVWEVAIGGLLGIFFTLFAYRILAGY